MAINEAPQSRSSLTEEQKRQAEAAIFGVPQPSGGQQLNYSAEQIEFLRAVVAQADAQHGQVREFDINKPPTPPYRYQEYPRMLYHHERRETKIAQNVGQFDVFRAQGYETEAFAPEVDNEPDLGYAARAEASAVDAELQKRDENGKFMRKR